MIIKQSEKGNRVQFLLLRASFVFENSPKYEEVKSQSIYNWANGKIRRAM
jgi:hypothetical protein